MGRWITWDTAASRGKYPLTNQPSWQADYYPHVLAYLSMVPWLSPEVTMGGRLYIVCGMLSSSSDIEGCRAVVCGVIWIRLL